MSKLGKKPIHIPKDTAVKVESGKLILTGPKGTKQLNINDKIFSTSISKDNYLIIWKNISMDQKQKRMLLLKVDQLYGKMSMLILNSNLSSIP